MKDMVNLRIVAICSNFAFIAYALLLHLLPILVLHVVLLPLNGWRLVQALPRSDYNIGGVVVKLLTGIRTTVYIDSSRPSAPAVKRKAGEDWGR